MRQIVSPLIAALLVSACAITPAYDRPQVETAQDWRPAENLFASAINPRWWEEFGSAELNGLIARALAENTDLAASLHRIEQARAGAKAAGAAFLPAIDASGGLSWTDSRPGQGRRSTEAGWRGGLDIGYELDLFGTNRAALGSAQADYRATVFDRDALALTTMAETADIYFTILSLRERTAIGRADLKAGQDVLDIVQARYDAGASSGLDLSRQKGAVASAEAALAGLESQQAVAENALAVLLGRAPQNGLVSADKLENLTLPAIAPLQPSALAGRRPDIRSAEERLIAANADIGVARAAFFPTINLGAGIAFAASPLSESASQTLSLLSGLTAPVFQGGRLEAAAESAAARHAELAQLYRKTVLTAFQEVEDALAVARAAAKRREAMARALEEARRSYDLSRELYEAGATDFQTFLDAQRTRLQAEDSYAVARLEQLRAAVDLFRALGGGWQETP